MRPHNNQSGYPYEMGGIGIDNPKKVRRTFKSILHKHLAKGEKK